MWFRIPRQRGAQCHQDGRKDELVVTAAGPGLVSIAPASGAWTPVLLSPLEVGQLRGRLRDVLLESYDVDERDQAVQHS